MTVTQAAVTTAPQPIPPAATTAGSMTAGQMTALAPWLPQPPPAPSLAPAVAAALPAAEGRAALLLPPLPRLAAPGRRRLAEALLEAAARTGGGAVFRGQAGQGESATALLLGAAPAIAAQAAAQLGGLAGAMAPLPLWHLPRDTAAVRAWAAGQVRPAGSTAEAPPAVGGLDAALDTLPPETILRAATLIGGGSPRGRWLRLSRRAVAAGLGPLAGDADLLSHALDRLAARLLPGLAAWAAAGPGCCLVPLPRHRLPPAAAAGEPIGVLPLASAADPDALADHRLALAGRGWRLALGGLDAAALRLVRPATLPADLLLLRWSPALAERGATAALASLDPARLVLTGALDAEALDWARHHRIGRWALPAGAAA